MASFASSAGLSLAQLGGDNNSSKSRLFRRPIGHESQGHLVLLGDQGEVCGYPGPTQVNLGISSHDANVEVIRPGAAAVPLNVEAVEYQG